MFENEMGHAEPRIRQNPKPVHPGNFQAAVSRQAGLDSRYLFLLRKCGKRDCRYEPVDSFRKGSPEDGYTYIHAPCGALDCRHCGPRHIERLRFKLNAAIREHGLFYCYTLTDGEQREGDSCGGLMVALQSLKARHRRMTGEPLRYIAVKSIGSRTGRAHLHLLTDTDWSLRWIKNWWVRRVHATQVRRQVNTLQTVDRLTNYMVVNYLECHLGGVRLKKITTSKGIDIAIRPPKRKDGERSEWIRWEMPTRSVAAVNFKTKLEDYPNNPLKVVVPPVNTSTEGSSAAERSENPPGMGSLSDHAAVTDSAPKATGLEPAASPHPSQALPAVSGAKEVRHDRR